MFRGGGGHGTNCGGGMSGGSASKNVNEIVLHYIGELRASTICWCNSNNTLVLAVKYIDVGNLKQGSTNSPSGLAIRIPSCAVAALRVLVAVVVLVVVILVVVFIYMIM